MLDAQKRSERAAVAALARHRGPDHPEVVERRRQYRADRLAEHIARVVDAAPPLTDAQRDRLASILRGGRIA